MSSAQNNEKLNTPETTWPVEKDDQKMENSKKLNHSSSSLGDVPDCLNPRPARFHNRDSIKVTRKRFTTSTHSSQENEGRMPDIPSPTQITGRKIKSLSNDTMETLPECLATSVSLKSTGSFDGKVSLRAFDPTRAPKKGILKKKNWEFITSSEELTPQNES